MTRAHPEYAVWETDWKRPADVLDVIMPQGWSKSLALIGRHIDVTLTPLHFVVSKTGELSDALVNQWNWRIFSPYLRQTLERLVSDPVQYLPVKLSRTRTGGVVAGYCLCNPLVVISALDRARSVLVYHQGSEDILGIDLLVLDEAKIGSHTFFRLQEYCPALIVRQDVAAEIQAAGYTGMQFTPLAHYRR